MIRQQERRGRVPRGERGSVLVLTLMISLLLLGLGLAALWISSSGSHQSGSLTRRQEASTAAYAGLERVRDIASNLTTWTGMLGASTGGSCTPPATKDDATLTGKGNVLCDPTTNQPLENVAVLPAGSASVAAAPEAANLAYTIYVKNDPVEFQNVATRYVDSDRRVLIRVEGVGRDGMSQVALEAILVPGGTGASAGGTYSQAGINAAGSNSARTAIHAGP